MQNLICNSKIMTKKVWCKINKQKSKSLKEQKNKLKEIE